MGVRDVQYMKSDWQNEYLKCLLWTDTCEQGMQDWMLNGRYSQAPQGSNMAWARPGT